MNSHLRRLGIVFVALVSLLLAAAPVRADSGPRAVFGEPGTVSINVPGAPIVCNVSWGNDVQVYDGFLNVTWAVACRYTDDGQLAYLETREILMVVGLFRNGSILGTTRTCPMAGPSSTCSHRVPYPATVGSYQSAMLAVVSWTDGYPPIRGTFVSPGFTYT